MDLPPAVRCRVSQADKEMTQQSVSRLLAGILIWVWIFWDDGSERNFRRLSGS